ncbi:hypothetical protein ACS5PN_07500 [Roseateles sp. NT4]|uniref:hypothetical protein n=1 Tax=Roseateles sp. NT4 TaxID=3453715 RepID=UPI003EEDC31E
MTNAAPLNEGNVHGFASSIYGGLSIAAVLAARQLEILWSSRGGHVLELAEKLGILQEPWVTPEMSNVTLLTITDGWIIAALRFFAAYLAVLAFAFALWAEHREEDSLYLGVGFLCGGMTLFLLQPMAGALVAVVGTGVILEMRRRLGMTRDKVFDRAADREMR